MVKCAIAGCYKERHPNGKGYCLSCKADTASIHGTRGAGYGLDAALAAKAAAKYDVGAEAQALEWITAVTGERIAQPFMETLKDGVILCKLANCFGAGLRINASRMPFKQMENITAFLRACKSLGVSGHDCFETVDLFDGKDKGLVIQTIHALGGVVCFKPGYSGPVLGKKKASKNVRNFSEATMAKARAAVPLTSLGGKKLDHHLDRTNDIAFGANNAGKGSYGKYADRGMKLDRGLDVHRDITYGAKMSGVSTSGHVGPKAKKLDIPTYGIRDVTFGATAGGNPPKAAATANFCGNCGAKNTGGKFCSNCGTPF